MDKKKRIITTIVAMAMFCMMSMSTLAATKVIVSLPENQVWTAGAPISRSGSFSYLWAGCDSVYPTSGKDSFTKIQVRLVSASGESIMKDDIETLTEGETSKLLYIKDGHLALKTVYIQFRGNTSAAAEAVVEYFSL